MLHSARSIITVLIALCAASYAANAQKSISDYMRKTDSLNVNRISLATPEDIDLYLLIAELDSLYPDTVVAFEPLPSVFFLPPVYDGYIKSDSASWLKTDFSGRPELRRLEAQQAAHNAMKRIQQSYFYTEPYRIPYNIEMLPEAPKRFVTKVNPEDHQLIIEEVLPEKAGDVTIAGVTVEHRHWIRSFNASLQFSQAYVSPNWYQGGNNNLNMLAQIYYNVKLNQEFHKNLLFETTMQYKLGMNSAPDDSVHNYSISEDILQVNTTFGVKAAKRWYYSFTGQFKTQMLNSYGSNSRTLRSAFLSPAELTLGIGMTYNYANAKKTVTFDASLAPLSYNMKTCINRSIDPTQYNIEEGRRTANNIGSSGEFKFFWRLADNITFNSRLFAFSDYKSFQADWENRLTFDINRFLSTQVYAHARYDTSTPPCDDDSWKKLQVKEILSIGFSYKFSSI